MRARQDTTTYTMLQACVGMGLAWAQHCSRLSAWKVQGRSLLAFLLLKTIDTSLPEPGQCAPPCPDKLCPTAEQPTKSKQQTSSQNCLSLGGGGMKQGGILFFKQYSSDEYRLGERGWWTPGGVETGSRTREWGSELLGSVLHSVINLLLCPWSSLSLVLNGVRQ